MSSAQSREHMDMISRAANGVRDALHPANRSADVFMNTVTMFWSHPRFAVLCAEDKMVVEGKMRRSHEVTILALLPERNPFASDRPVVALVPRFTTG